MRGIGWWRFPRALPWAWSLAEVHKPCVWLYLTAQPSLECGGPEAQALGIFNLTPLSFADGVRACRSPRIDSRLRFAGKQSGAPSTWRSRDAGAGAPHRRGTRGLDPSSPPQRAAEIKSGVPERLPSASGCATSRRTPQIAPAVLRATCRDQIAHWATLICAKLPAQGVSPGVAPTINFRALNGRQNPIPIIPRTPMLPMSPSLP